MTKLNTPRNNSVKEETNGLLTEDWKTEEYQKQERAREISNINRTSQNSSFSVIIKEPDEFNHSSPTKKSKWQNPKLRQFSNGNESNNVDSLKQLGFQERGSPGVSSASSGSGAKLSTSTSLSFSPRLKRKSINSKTSVSTDLLRFSQKTDKCELSSREIVTKVYQLWEPQLSSSYRPTSIRIPSAKVAQKQPTISGFTKSKRKAVMGMLSFMKKK